MRIKPQMGRSFFRGLAVSLLLAAGLLAGGGCQARKTYQEPDVGWHAGNFSSVFGRLERVAGPTATARPYWVLRFGRRDEPFQGELALTPEGPLVGYAGGEMVEVKGHMLGQATSDAYNGKWYVVESIQLWSSYKQ